ncbi:metallophosphoesterase family protein [Bacillus alkalicellulosilyticus]|uniref:metallophosphoesterase family protein n=1 Tax=Alkalihalobacterium alkalicellulosilyticum TaxID=1912214 RepID=UPI0009988BAB|nr:DNA repair exonuclease [Bacillus alkalicellulosilyticus]
MAAIRFIHTADLHLDSPFKGMSHLPSTLLERIQESTFTSFQSIVTKAIAEQVDFLLVCGDVFDEKTRSLRAQSFFKKQCQRLYEHKIAVFVIHGNHDHLSGQWVSLDWPDNVYFFGGEVSCQRYITQNNVVVHLYGFSYKQREVEENMTSYYRKTAEADFHIGLLHGQAEGMGGHHNYAPFTIAELEAIDFDYWALGHIHQRQSLNSTIIYPGNIQGRHRNEQGEKGCLLVEMNEHDHRQLFISTADIIWEELYVEITGLDSEQQLIDVLELKKDEHRKDVGVMMHIVFIGHGPLHMFLSEQSNIEEVLSILNEDENPEVNFVWFCSHDQKTTGNWNRETLKETHDFLGELLKVSETIQTGSGEALFKELVEHRKAKKYMTKWSNDEMKQIIKDAETYVVEELVKRWQD